MFAQYKHAYLLIQFTCSAA